MSDISVVGLGLMGSALARALLVAGDAVTVWNRSPERCSPLVAEGAVAAASLAEAVSASPVIVVCIDSYATAQALIGARDVASQLTGRLVVQMSTGSPGEARSAEAWFEAQGAHYLDGAILCGPKVIGTADAVILFSGKGAHFQPAEVTLRALAPGARWVGESVGAASALDLAWLAQLYGTYVAAAHGALICGSEGLDLDLYLSVLNPTGAAYWIVKAMKDEAFDSPTATLSVWNGALRRIADHARTAGISSEVPDVVGRILDRAEAAGLGAQHIAAMVKVLGGGAGSGPP